MECMTAKDSQKVHTNKTTNISDEEFADLKQALENALVFERGEGRDLSITRIQAAGPPEASRNIVKS
jgi:hypothetical protein